MSSNIQEPAADARPPTTYGAFGGNEGAHSHSNNAPPAAYNAGIPPRPMYPQQFSGAPMGGAPPAGAYPPTAPIYPQSQLPPAQTAPQQHGSRRYQSYAYGSQQQFRKPKQHDRRGSYNGFNGQQQRQYDGQGYYTAFTQFSPKPAVPTQVTMTDANGNPIDLHSIANKKHSQDGVTQPTPPAAKPQPASASASDVNIVLAPPSKETPEFVKPANAPNSAGLTMMELVAKRRAEKEAAERAKKGAGASTDAVVKPDSSQNLKTEPKQESATESKSEPTPVKTPGSDTKSTPKPAGETTVASAKSDSKAGKPVVDRVKSKGEVKPVPEKAKATQHVTAEATDSKAKSQLGKPAQKEAPSSSVGEGAEDAAVHAAALAAATAAMGGAEKKAETKVETRLESRHAVKTTPPKAQPKSSPAPSKSPLQPSESAPEISSGAEPDSKIEPKPEFESKPEPELEPKTEPTLDRATESPAPDSAIKEAATTSRPDGESTTSSDAKPEESGLKYAAKPFRPRRLQEAKAAAAAAAAAPAPGASNEPPASAEPVTDSTGATATPDVVAPASPAPESAADAESTEVTPEVSTPAGSASPRPETPSAASPSTPATPSVTIEDPDAAFAQRVEKARRLTAAELTTFAYPNGVRNAAADGSRLIYAPEFMRLFQLRVPRLKSTGLVRSLDSDGGSWTSRGGRGARGAPFSSRGSGRGPPTKSRQSSRRKDKRHDDSPLVQIPIEDLPPLQTAENAWKPNFKLRMEAAKAAGGDDAKAVVPVMPAQVPLSDMTPEQVKKKTNSLLNKMSLENLGSISNKLYEVILLSENENDAHSLKEVITLAFNKAIDEPNYSKVYVEFFLYIHRERPVPETIVDSTDDRERKGIVLMRHILIYLCQEGLKGESYLTDDIPTPDDLSDEYYEFMAKKRRAIGLIKFVGELYKAGLIRVAGISACFFRLANSKPTEDVVESITQLLRSVAHCMVERGEDSLLPLLLGKMEEWRSSGNLPPRLRFMLLDVEQLAKNRWIDPKGDTGPMTIAEVHREAKVKEEQERQKQMQMRSRGGGRGRLGGGGGGPFRKR